MKAMAHTHPVRFQTHHHTIGDVRSQQDYQPMDWPREREILVTPAHGLGHRQIANCLGNDVWQHAQGGHAWLDAAQHKALHTAGPDPLQLVDRDAILGCETRQSGR